MIEKDMEEEVSHWPPVSIYLNLFNDINIDITSSLFAAIEQAFKLIMISLLGR